MYLDSALKHKSVLWSLCVMLYSRKQHKMRAGCKDLIWQSVCTSQLSEVKCLECLMSCTYNHRRFTNYKYTEDVRTWRELYSLSWYESILCRVVTSPFCTVWGRYSHLGLDHSLHQQRVTNFSYYYLLKLNLILHTIHSYPHPSHNFSSSLPSSFYLLLSLKIIHTVFFIQFFTFRNITLNLFFSL